MRNRLLKRGSDNAPKIWGGAHNAYNSWKRREKITVNPNITSISGVFGVWLGACHGLGSDIWSIAKSDGSDIIAVAEDGTKLNRSGFFGVGFDTTNYKYGFFFESTGDAVTPNDVYYVYSGNANHTETEAFDPPANVLGLWVLDNLPSATAPQFTDYSANNNHMSDVSLTDSDVVEKWAINRGIKVNGTNKGITVGDGVISTYPFTVINTFRNNSSSDAAGRLHFTSTAHNDQVWTGKRATTKVLQAGISNSGSDFIEGNTVLTDNETGVQGFTASATELDIYWNGKKDADTVTHSRALPTLNTFSIGMRRRLDGDAFYDGTFNMTAVFATKYTDDEMLTLTYLVAAPARIFVSSGTETKTGLVYTDLVSGPTVEIGPGALTKANRHPWGTVPSLYAGGWHDGDITYLPYETADEFETQGMLCVYKQGRGFELVPLSYPQSTLADNHDRPCIRVEANVPYGFQELDHSSLLTYKSKLARDYTFFETLAGSLSNTVYAKPIRMTNGNYVMIHRGSNQRPSYRISTDGLESFGASQPIIDNDTGVGFTYALVPFRDKDGLWIAMVYCKTELVGDQQWQDYGIAYASETDNFATWHNPASRFGWAGAWSKDVTVAMITTAERSTNLDMVQIGNTSIDGGIPGVAMSDTGLVYFTYDNGTDQVLVYPSSSGTVTKTISGITNMANIEDIEPSGASIDHIRKVRFLWAETDSKLVIGVTGYTGCFYKCVLWQSEDQGTSWSYLGPLTPGALLDQTNYQLPANLLDIAQGDSFGVASVQSQGDFDEDARGRTLYGQVLQKGTAPAALSFTHTAYADFAAMATDISPLRLYDPNVRDGSDNLTDLSGNAQHATKVGGITFNDGYYTTNGLSGYMSVPITGITTASYLAYIGAIRKGEGYADTDLPFLSMSDIGTASKALQFSLRIDDAGDKAAKIVFNDGTTAATQEGHTLLAVANWYVYLVRVTPDYWFQEVGGVHQQKSVKSGTLENCKGSPADIPGLDFCGMGAIRQNTDTFYQVDYGPTLISGPIGRDKELKALKTIADYVSATVAVPYAA